MRNYVLKTSIYFDENSKNEEIVWNVSFGWVKSIIN